jgi:restriction endonuclease S subunit
MKNGLAFTSIINAEDFKPGVWDPFYYRACNAENKLSNYVEIRRGFSYRYPLSSFKFLPIEYKDIFPGNHLTFNLKLNDKVRTSERVNAVPEDTLLFGTMRAYLGNVIVTPKSSWLNEETVWFSTNSEFCEIIPLDGLKYFWLIFLKSMQFKNNLPTGTGGTRPRVNTDQLYQIPVIVPELEERRKIDSEIKLIAEKMWVEQTLLSRIIERNSNV